MAVTKKACVQVPFFEGAEHDWLGNSVSLRGLDIEPRHVLQIFHRSDPSQFVWLSYGEICALAGDFYGTYTPICYGEKHAGRAKLFLEAYDLLKHEAMTTMKSLQELLRKEISMTSPPYPAGVQGSEKWRHEPVSHKEWEKVTMNRNMKLPSFLALATINFDHFGEDAYNVYCSIHQLAIEQAAQGRSVDNLRAAYAMNAFADHFLQDLFSAGHLRTPRRALHDWKHYKNRELDRLARVAVNFWQWRVFPTLWYMSRDLLSKIMHDEESEIGLKVKGDYPTNDGKDTWTTRTWKCYGDKRLHDDIDDENKSFCQKAVQASVDEVFEAWKTQKPLPLPTDKDETFKFNLTRMRPVPCAQDEQALQPLAMVSDGRLTYRYPWFVEKSPLRLPWIILQDRLKVIVLENASRRIKSFLSKLMWWQGK
ncbi:hypothetical protein ED733_000582 [Metarhizium rileyi]|uniref:Uncharacterized protein n=1 Tax=Metarhizium rileyi (strain RCEF 4871) TaxID=1649241 RepID=A0A5C6G3F9_METRR|nr:hypothetical protein ED733_000582 [Metarhizium rileyi]